MTTHIMIFGRLRNSTDDTAFEAASPQVSRTIFRSTSDILSDELARDIHDPDSYILLSQWKSKEAWASWQRSPLHEQQVAPLQRYWTGQGVRIYESVFALDTSEK